MTRLRLTEATLQTAHFMQLSRPQCSSSWRKAWPQPKDTFELKALAGTCLQFPLMRITCATARAKQGRDELRWSLLAMIRR